MGPPSLQACCLGVLGEHLEALLDDPEIQLVLPLLPVEAKACLLAVARVRRMLSDAALLLLADEGQHTLDLHDSGSGTLSDAGIRAAIQRMPDLRQADLRSCPVGGDTLRALGRCCPHLSLLLLGSPVTDATAARLVGLATAGGAPRAQLELVCCSIRQLLRGAAQLRRAPPCPEPCRSGLRDVLPTMDQRHLAPAADSWDALLEVGDDAAALAAALAGGGRLMQLRCVAWPNMPHRLAERCRLSCPQLALNPSAEQVAALRLPRACDPGVQLDAPLLEGVAGSTRWERQAAVQPRAPAMHIAEKFRLAYISREQRVRAKMERNRQQQRRRELRRSQAEAVIRQWESEL